MAKHLVLGLAMALAWTTMVLAGEEAKPAKAVGTFVGAKVEGDLVKLEIDLGEQGGGKKTFELSTDVRVIFREKDGVKTPRFIMRASNEFTPKEGMSVATGKFTGAKVEGDNVLVTVTPTEGEKPAPIEVKLPKQVSVGYREGEGGKLVATSLGGPRGRKAEAK